jgi:hypothetical protein
MKTIEDLNEEYGNFVPHFSKKNIVVLENGIIKKIGVVTDIYQYLIDVEKINFTDYRGHVIEWIQRCLKSKKRYLGYHYQFYNRCWKRKIKIEKLLKI